VKRLSKAISFIAISFMLFISLSTPAYAAAKGAHERVELTPHVAAGIQDRRPNLFQVAEKKHSNKADQKSKTIETARISNDVNDPLEPVNRITFKFNEIIQVLVLRPLAEIYKLILPDQGQIVVRNFLKNLRSPVVLANDLLQGETDRAWTTTQRLAINTTLGIGGLLDVANKWGIKSHSEDLGQTFAVWGVPDGFYLVLPIFGPSNPRDTVGKLVTSYLDPFSYWLRDTHGDDWSNARTVVGGVDEFSGVMNDLQKLKDASVDYYAALRSISRQKRNTEIRNGKLGDAPIFNLKYDFDADLTFQ
jgi:phospholipid-binding lipoprotein MlaA